MKKIQIYIIAGLLSLIAASCTTLDEDPRSTQVTTQFYRNENDAKAAVTAIYASLVTGNDPQTLYNRGVQIATEIGTDDYKAGVRASNANVQAMSNNTNDASNDRTQSIWEDSYSLINNANLAIDHIAEIPSGNISESKRAQYINEAKFLRALTYFNLVRWFKYIPLVLHETNSLNSSTLNVSQASEDEVYDQIISDLKDAENLPSPKELAGDDAGRATAGAAKALLAKVYLTRQQWQLAADKAKEIIDSGWYDLFDNFSDVFDAATKNGKEHIFSIQFKGNNGAYTHTVAWAATTYEVPGIIAVHADALNLASDLYSSFSDNDKRKDVTFVTKMVSPTNGRTYTLSEPHFYKYYDPTTPSSPAQSSRNIPVLRYAEVLLIYAEALNELNGPTPTAYEAIDKVRARAGIPKLADIAPNLTKDEFRDSVFQERRKEFVYEGKRWFDLSRRGADYFVKELHAAGKTNAQPRNIHLPIPQRELDLNSNLKQNPDWE